MNINEIKEWIESWEDRRPHVYTDTMGHPTIGVGFNLDRSDARRRIEDLGLDYEQVRAGQIDLSNEQIDQLLDADVERAIADARNIVSNFDTIPEAKQKVVVDMVFNLGAAGFSGFHNTIKAIEEEDWQRAAREMKDSRWFKQVGNRGVKNVQVMGSAV
jgi:GH24 family phage-related lysozyme (muramidase)